MGTVFPSRVLKNREALKSLLCSIISPLIHVYVQIGNGTVWPKHSLSSPFRSGGTNQDDSKGYFFPQVLMLKTGLNQLLLLGTLLRGTLLFLFILFEYLHLLWTSK